MSLCAALPDRLDVQQLLEVAVRNIASFFDADCCVVFLKAEEQLVPAAWVGFPAQPPPALEETSGRGLQRHLEGFLAAGRCRRFMSASLVAGDERIGELAVFSLVDGRPPYSREDREALKLLAHHLAATMHNVRLLERARGQQEALARIAAALAQEVEVRKTAQTAADLAVGELGADAAVVWMARPEERVLEWLAFTGYDEEVFEPFRRLSFDAPALASAVATTQKMEIVENVEEMPESQAMTKRAFLASGVRSDVVAPLMARGRLVGVFAFAKKTPHRWESGELMLVRNLADLLAAGIFNAQLYEESERRRLLAEAVIDNSPLSITVSVGPERRFVLVNAAFERITGRPREQALGRTPAEVFPDLVGTPVEDAVDRVYETGQTVVIPELHYDYGPPVGARDISLLFAPLRGPDGKIEGVIGMVPDVTEQVAARRQLEELNSRLKAANEQLVQASLRSSELIALAQQRAAELEATITNLPDAAFVCDPEGKITLINRAGLEMIGVERPSELRTLVDYLVAAKVRYLDGRPVPREELAISRALRGEVVRGMEEVIYDSRLQRDRYILASAAPIRDQQGRSLGAVEVLSDITRLKELDLLKDQFITVAAHEIKTPVTAIKGFAQTLARAPDACAPRYRRALETIVRQSDRIDALVRDFLDASGLRWGRVALSLERIDLPALVAEEVARKAATTTKHRLVMSRRDPAWVNGDRDRLTQVVESLLDNAIKFSPRGGEVEVRVVREENRAVVSVRDWGVGIPKDRQAHVFERFYRAHIGTPYDYGGLGVGLYISREIVRRHGGEMWFESQEGRGSTFYFSLPLAPQ